MAVDRSRGPAATAIVTLALLVGAAGQASAADVTFAPGPGSPVPTGFSDSHIAAGDLDGDGYADVVLAEFAAAELTVRWGRADGGLDPPTTVPVPAPAKTGEIALGDVGGSGLPDIVFAYERALALVSDGDRTFTPATPAPLDPAAPNDFSGSSPTLADFDGDGDRDLAATVYDRKATSGGGTVRIYAGDGDGNFAPAGVYESDRKNLAELVTGRFDANADPDLAYQYYVEKEDPDLPDDVLVGILRGASGLTFTQGTPFNIYGEVDNPDLRGAADLDRPADGFDDLYFSASIDLRWANGDGTFSADEVEVDTGEYADVVAGDVTGDGAVDLIGVGDTTRVVANCGGRAFASDAAFDLPSAYEFRFIAGTVGDFDADPLRDLAVIADADGDDEIEVSTYLARDAGAAGCTGGGGGSGGGGDPTPPPGGGTPPPATAPPPAGGPPPPPGPPAPAPLVPVQSNQIATLPPQSRRPCGSRRNFRIRLRRPPEGVTVTEARVLVNGKRVAVRRGARLTAPVDLRGFPKGKAVVTIRITLADGRVLRGRRSYRPCATKKRKGKFGRRRARRG